MNAIFPVRQLSEIAASVDYGVTASASVIEGGAKFLRITDIQDGTVNWQTVPFCDAPPKKLRSARLTDGDIVFARTGATTGKSFLIKSPPDGAVFASYLIRVRPSACVNPAYLAHFFQSNGYWSQIRRKTQGAAQGGVNATSLSEIEIPLPPLDKQRRIAAILDRADALRRKRKRALDLLDSLTQSIFLKMFGDPVRNTKSFPWKTFGEIGQLDRGVSKHRPRNDPKLLGGEHPLIQTGDVANSGGYITHYSSTYSDAGLRQSKKWLSGTLCITIAANIAQTGILTFPACFPDSVVGFSHPNKAMIQYVRVWLMFLRPMLESTAPTVAQKNINLEILRKLPIALPPVGLIDQFGARLEQQRAIATSLQVSKFSIERLFSSLQFSAFSGQL